MKFLLPLTLVLVCSALAFGQKSNDVINKQIKSLKADKTITLTFDGASSKVMARATNFSDADAKAAGVRAMNFAMAFFYPGEQLSVSPDTINFTFWVLSKKPRFGPAGKWEIALAGAPLDLGEYRYAAKPSEDMEYLNFKILRSDLAKVASSTAPVKFHLGSYSFTFTAEQMQMLRSFIAISDTK